MRAWVIGIIVVLVTGGVVGGVVAAIISRKKSTKPTPAVPVTPTPSNPSNVLPNVLPTPSTPSTTPPTPSNALPTPSNALPTPSDTSPTSSQFALCKQTPRTREPCARGDGQGLGLYCPPCNAEAAADPNYLPEDYGSEAFNKYASRSGSSAFQQCYWGMPGPYEKCRGQTDIDYCAKEWLWTPNIVKDNKYACPECKAPNPPCTK